MKIAIIEINPDWKSALRAGEKGIRQAAQSGCEHPANEMNPRPGQASD